MTDRTVKVRVKGDISDFNRAMLTGAASAKAFTKELDTSNERTTVLTQSLLAVGPSLVPIAAAGVPAVAGLTNQLGFAAAGAGVAALAFSGVGDALKAVNDFAVEPTDANLRKLNETMNEIGPAGRNFVLFLQDLRPQLQGLQDIAQAGLLPGVEQGITSLLSRMPEAERIISTISTTLGDLTAEAGANLADSRWNDFFDFLEREARPTLLDLGRAVGNFTEAFANLWMAFQPLSSQFSRSFLDLSRDFAKWTDGLDQTEGFQDFLAYVSRVGPEVWETLGDLGNALVQIVEAAAPIGEASLPVIQLLAKALSAIADSPAGPVLIATAAGISALSRAIALYKTVNGSAIASLLGVADNKGKRAALGFRTAAAGAGLLALSLTDLDDKAGIANTASYALLGTLIAPGWGTAIGGTIGLVKDLSAANDEAADSLDRLATKVNEVRSGADAHDVSVTAIALAGDDPGLQKRADAISDAAYKNAEAARDQALAEAGLASNMALASDEVKDETLALLDNVRAKNQAADAAESVFSAETAYRQALKDAQEQARKTNAGINGSSDAALKNREALDRLASAWNRQADAGGKTEAQMRKAQREFINAAVGMGVARGEAKRLADELFHIPSPKPKVTLTGVEQAFTQISKLKEYLRGIKDEDVIIHVRRAIESGGGRGHQTAFAEGGPVRGPGGPRDDVIPALLSNGEYVINAAATSRHRELLDRINSQRYAGGGFVQPTGAGVSTDASSTGAVLAPGARFRLVGSDLIELVDNRVAIGTASEQNYQASKRRAGRK